MTIEGQNDEQVQRDESQRDEQRDHSQESGDQVAFNYARRLYQRAKQTTQTYAPTVVSQALDRVESRVADQLQHLNYETYESAKQTYAPVVVAKALDLAESRIGQVVETSKAAVSASKAAAQNISDQYSSLLRTTQEKIDTLIPEEEDEDEEGKQEVKSQNNETPSTDESVSLRSVSSHVTKRLIKRAQVSLVNLKMVAPERLAAMVHVDLIAYAEQVLDATKDKAQHALETTRNNEHVNAALTKLENSVAAVKTAVANVSEPVVRPVEEKVARLSKNASRLRIRVGFAGRKARDLTAHSASYLMTHQIRSMPRDALNTLVHYSVDYIAPLFGAAPPDHENADFQDLDAKVKDLLSALRDVLIWDNLEAEEEAHEQEQQEPKGAATRRGTTSPSQKPRGGTKPRGATGKPARH